MQARDNASAARSCLILLGVGAALLLIACVMVALAVAPFDILPRPTPQPEDRRGTVTSESPLRFTVMEIGQGACVVVITPDGRTLIADAGRSQERVRRVVLPYLREHGVERIDYLVVTNPDQDHIGGMPALIEDLPVGAWVDPAVPTTNQTYERLLTMVIERDITPIRARRGTTLDLGPDVQAEIIWPTDPFIPSETNPSRNDNSVVIQITHGDVRFLITGDIEAPAEQQIIEQGTNEQLRSDVMVAPHHGSRTSSTAEFLDVVAPNVVIIPVGLDNQYGHPHDEAIQRLRFRNIRIYRTDLDGTVEITSDGSTYQVTVLGPGVP
jgi:competence protein ComEC